MKKVLFGCGVVAAAILQGCGGGSSADLASPSGPAVASLPVLGAASPGAIQKCADLKTAFTFANTTIDSSDAVAAGTLKLAGADIAAHCLVKGAMFKRTGTNGNYAIGFEMRMPNNWNGRYFYQANGGLDGSVSTAQGSFGGGPVTSALMQGFAVISSDAGHTGAQTTQFGFEPQARLDYGYQAVGKLTPMAKDLIKAAYGRGPDRSYIGGCSNGGRHTLVATSRYADMYDGFLAGAPGYNLPKSAVSAIFMSQQFNTIATSGATVTINGAPAPDLATGFTQAERKMVASKILGKCDALDGLTDGIIGDVNACQTAFNFATDVPTCTGARDGTCLTAAQKTVVAKAHSGATTTAGGAIYSKFWWDAGIGSDNWAVWKFTNSIALDPLAVGTVFGTPPAFIANSITANVDNLFAGITATNATYTESGMSFMTPPNPTNLATLKNRGAKVLVYHGAADPIFSSADTATWYDGLKAANGGDASNFARYFVIPSMPHCSGGASTDQIDPLTPLVNWVENGTTPELLVATARGVGNAGGVNPEIPSDWSQSRTRLLCPFPKVATYTGGNRESAGSFECK